MPRRARPLNLLPGWTSVTLPSSRVPVASTVRPLTISARDTDAVTRSSSCAVADDSDRSVRIASIESALTVCSSNCGLAISTCGLGISTGAVSTTAGGGGGAGTASSGGVFAGRGAGGGEVGDSTTGSSTGDGARCGATLLVAGRAAATGAGAGADVGGGAGALVAIRAVGFGGVLLTMVLG